MKPFPRHDVAEAWCRKNAQGPCSVIMKGNLPCCKPVIVEYDPENFPVNKPVEIVDEVPDEKSLRDVVLEQLKPEERSIDPYVNGVSDIAFLEDLATHPLFKDAIRHAQATHAASMRSPDLASAKDPRYAGFYAEATAFLADLTNPKYANRSMTQIARKHGITVEELAELFRTHSFTRAYFEAFDKLPGIVKAQAEASLPKDAPCPKCDGIGQISVERGNFKHSKVERRECPQCKGTAIIRTEPNDKAVGRIWQMVGFEKPAQTNVTVDQRTFSGESVIEELERLDRKKPVAIEAKFDES